MPAPTTSTATMVFDPGRKRLGSLSSTSCGRNRSSLRPRMLASFFVDTTEPSTLARNMISRQPSLLLRQHRADVVVGPRDHVHADQLSLDIADGLRAGVGRGLDRGH